MTLPPVLAWSIALLSALLFGSFLNVCIARLPQHRSIVQPGSHCPRCQAPVRARDNVPVVSWLLLGGRCRACRLPIALRYPLVEAGYTALVAASISRFGWSAEALASSIFCFLVLGLLVIDLETMLLPDAFTLPGIGLGAVWALAEPGIRPDVLFWTGHTSDALTLGVAGLERAALSAAGWAGLLLLIRWSYYALRRREGLGLGDVKLVAMLAAWLGGSRTALCFLLAVVGAALAGVAMMVGRTSRKGAPSRNLEWGALRIPLGAFLCSAGLYALFFGERSLSWYFSFWL